MSISIKERRALERAVDALGYAREQLGLRRGWEYNTENEEKDVAKARKAFRALLDKLSEPDVKR